MANHPEHIGPYRILMPIAQGGMAEVFEVEDPASGEKLALKLLQRLKVALKRFNREYEAMARLNHPGVVRTYHYGLHNGRPWLTMELLQGYNAHGWCKRFGPPGTTEREAEVIRLTYHLATSLHYIHDRGLVHRDIKSANVVVLPDARVKMVDFGTAHLVDATERITQDGEFVGTFAYASPEQLSGGAPTHKSDLYSLGVLLYRLSTGRRPFGARDPAELSWQHMHDAPPDPRGFVPRLPDPLATLILHLLEKDPLDRPADAGAVAAVLEQLAGRPFPTHSAVAVHRARATRRHAERSQVWRRLDEANPGALVVVTGDAGSDRERFLADLEADARQQGWAPWPAKLRKGRDVAALIRLFLSLAEGLEGDDVERAVASIRSNSRLEMRARPEARAALWSAAAVLVEARTHFDRRRPLMLLHEVEQAGAIGVELIAGLRKDLQRKGIYSAMILSGASTVIDRGALLARHLKGAWRLHLNALTAAELASAVGTMLGRRPPPAHIALQLHRVTGGQPLYLEQMVARLVGSGQVEAEDNRLEWATPTHGLRPPLQATQDARRVLEAMPLCQRRVLEALSAAEGASASVLARLLAWQHQELAPVLRDLVTLGAIDWSGGPEAVPTWAHRATMRAVYDGLSPCRKALLQSRLAASVAGGPPSVVQVRALQAAGQPIEAALAAGVVCRELLDQHRVRTALALLEPVVRGLAGQAVPNVPELAEVFLLHSLCLQVVNPSHSDTARTLGLAKQLASEEVETLARVTWGQATFARSIGHYRNYAKGIEDALGLLENHETSEQARILLLMDQGHSRRLRGSINAAEKSYQEAERLARNVGSSRPMAQAMVGVAACRVDMGDIVEGELLASRAMALLERIGDEHGFWMALALWGQALRRQGRYSDVLPMLYRRAPEARQQEDPRAYAQLLLVTAWCEVDLERLGQAQEYVDELTAITGKGGHLHIRLESNLVHGRILLASGQPRHAAYRLQGVEQKARLAELRVIAEQARAWHAEALWALGDRETARAMFQSAVLGLMGLGVRPALGEVCVSRARRLVREQPPAELFQPVRGWLDTAQPPLLHLEELLAQGVWSRRQGDRAASRQAYREAAIVLNRVATGLNDTDRAALRIHSLSRRIRRGLR